MIDSLPVNIIRSAGARGGGITRALRGLTIAVIVVPVVLCVRPTLPPRIALIGKITCSLASPVVLPCAADATWVQTNNGP